MVIPSDNDNHKQAGSVGAAGVSIQSGAVCAAG